MPAVALATIYLVVTVLCVDTVYRAVVSIGERLKLSRSTVPESLISLILGLIPAFAGLATAAVFSLATPTFHMVRPLAGPGLAGALRAGFLMASCCSLLAVGSGMLLRLIKPRRAPSAQFATRTAALGIVAVDLLAWAAFEEVVFRGQILNVLMTRFSPEISMLGSSVIFAALHIWKRREAPIVWAINTGLFGLLAAKLVLATGTMASAIALHFLWNLLETPVLGLPANGAEYDLGLLTCEVNGPDIVTGGKWSLDAGLVSTAALMAGIGIAPIVVRFLA